NQSSNTDELVSTSIQSTTQAAPIPNESVEGKIRLHNDLAQNESATEEATTSTNAEDADPTADALDEVDGIDRHKGHHDKGHHHNCHDGHKDECKKEKPTCEKEEHKCNACGKATPTYHININCEDSRYKTISLPAQGRPFEYGEDVRNSLPPLVDQECCQRYCYAPCQQPTCGAYEACCPQPPPPQPCCPPPPFIYDECCDEDVKKKHKKLGKLKSKLKSKHKGGDGYQGRYANGPNNVNNENNNINGNPREEDEE
ncbi:hypothetical protein IW150_006180, partial [Coemansia sp. RSA 2607]